MIGNKFGQKKDKPDSRDFMYSAPAHIVAALPTWVDLRKGLLQPPYSQGDLGSCTANAIASAISFSHKKQGDSVLWPSRLFIYYNEREIEGTVDQDSGAYIRDGIKTVNREGVCRETLQPYEVSKFTVKPPNICYIRALKDQVVSYERVTQSLSQLKGCLAAGYPFIFGFNVYESFCSSEVEATGIVPMPNSYEECLGGHAVLAVGYNNKYKRFLVRNSWGKDWGIKGCFTIPYEYLTNKDLADDFWTIKMIAR